MGEVAEQRMLGAGLRAVCQAGPAVGRLVVWSHLAEALLPPPQRLSFGFSEGPWCFLTHILVT